MVHLRRIIQDIGSTVIQIHRKKATEILEFEVKELHNILALLVMGSLVGIPSPSPAIGLELLPYMEAELLTMIQRADFAQDPLGALMGFLNID